MLKSSPNICKLLTILALILAMAASGFAHAGARPTLSPDLAAYVAAGGSFADICGTSGEQDSRLGQKCEACLLIGAALLPRSCHGVPLTLSEQTRILIFVAKRLHNTRQLDSARLARAPPQA
jgi:hypothetical protein